jgi:hypothetical protein
MTPATGESDYLLASSTPTQRNARKEKLIAQPAGDGIERCEWTATPPAVPSVSPDALAARRAGRLVPTCRFHSIFSAVGETVLACGFRFRNILQSITRLGVIIIGLCSVRSPHRLLLPVGRSETGDINHALKLREVPMALQSPCAG